MRAAEVHLLWARAADGSHSGLAAREIEEAAALERDSPEVAYSRGCLALTAGDGASAAEAFRQARALAGDDPRFLFGLALATGDCAARSGSPRDTNLCDSLVDRAFSPEEKALSGLYLARIGRRDEALSRTTEAFAADRRCQRCALALADLLTASGNPDRALVVLQQATSVAPETRVDRALAAAIEKLQMRTPAR
jgi:tetratricopeptide (TPR) repeat protein